MHDESTTESDQDGSGTDSESSSSYDENESKGSGKNSGSDDDSKSRDDGKEEEDGVSASDNNDNEDSNQSRDLGQQSDDESTGIVARGRHRSYNAINSDDGRQSEDDSPRTSHSEDGENTSSHGTTERRESIERNSGNGSREDSGRSDKSGDDAEQNPAHSFDRSDEGGSAAGDDKSESDCTSEREGGDSGEEPTAHDKSSSDQENDEGEGKGDDGQDAQSVSGAEAQAEERNRESRNEADEEDCNDSGRRASRGPDGSSSHALSSHASSRASSQGADESYQGGHQAGRVVEATNTAATHDSTVSLDRPPRDKDATSTFFGGDSDNGSDDTDRNRRRESVSARVIQRRVRGRQAESKRVQDDRQKHQAAAGIQANVRSRWSRRDDKLQSILVGQRPARDRVKHSSGDAGGPRGEEEAARCIQKYARRNLKRKSVDADRSLHGGSGEKSAVTQGEHAAEKSIRKHETQKISPGNVGKTERSQTTFPLARSRGAQPEQLTIQLGCTTLTEDAAARRIQKGAWRRTARKKSNITGASFNNDDDGHRTCGQGIHGSTPNHGHDPCAPHLFSSERTTATHSDRNHHPSSSQSVPRAPVISRSPPPPAGWLSPGKAAAKAAAAVAAAAATAANASVRAAEAAADAVEAAEIAADAEEQQQESFGIHLYRNSPARSYSRSPRRGCEHCSCCDTLPSRVSRSTVGAVCRQEPSGLPLGGGGFHSPPHSRRNPSPIPLDVADDSHNCSRNSSTMSAIGVGVARGPGGGGVSVSGSGESGGPFEGNRRPVGRGGDSSRVGEEEMLKRAREQVCVFVCISVCLFCVGFRLWVWQP